MPSKLKVLELAVAIIVKGTLAFVRALIGYIGVVLVKGALALVRRFVDHVGVVLVKGALALVWGLVDHVGVVLGCAAASAVGGSGGRHGPDEDVYGLRLKSVTLNFDPVYCISRTARFHHCCGEGI
jgi:hypothetical protein